MTPASAAELSPDAEALLQAGLEHHQAGEREAAEALFRRAAAARPGEPTALYLLGLARFEAGDAAEARRLLEEVVALKPRHVLSRLTLANLLHWTGDHAGAAETYRQAILLEPGHAGALIGLSQSLLSAGDPTGALAASQAAAAAAPGDPAAHLALAAALMSLTQPAAAATAYRAAAACQPDAAEAHVGLALALLQSGEAEAALHCAERAVALDDKLAPAWFALGAVLRAIGRPEPAAQALERSVGLDPAHAAAHLSLGIAYIDLDQPSPAKRHLLRAVEIDPASKEAHANLSSLYYRSDHWQAAREHAQRALELDPEMIVAHQNLAGLLARDGREEEARRHRDLAYGKQNLFITKAAQPIQRVLVLMTSESGNVPERYLLPAARYTRLNWFVEYAQEQQMAALPPYDVVFNTIGDQDFAGPTARNVRRFMAGCTRRVINHPDRIERTSRHLAPALFAGIADVVTPAVARLDAETLATRGFVAAAGLAGITPPLLIRPAGAHGGEGLVLLSTGDDAAAGAAGAAGAAAPVPGRDYYGTAFHDFRSPDGFYRKYRIIFVDRRPYPYHLACAPGWLVHYGTSGTAEHAKLLAEEQRFLDDPEAALGSRAMAAIRAIGERLDLDFCGIDFSLLDDGQVLMFEANATMLVHPEAPDGPLAHKNPYVERILEAFRAMLARPA